MTVVHVRRLRVLVRWELDRQLDRLLGGQQDGVLPAELRIGSSRPWRNDLNATPWTWKLCG
jgi:hypothetical protein